MGHHPQPRLVDDVQEVLGINGESVSRRQHLLLVVLLETKIKKKKKYLLVEIYDNINDNVFPDSLVYMEKSNVASSA